MRFCFTVLREEIETALRLLGVNSIAELSPKHVFTLLLLFKVS